MYYLALNNPIHLAVVTLAHVYDIHSRMLVPRKHGHAWQLS